MSEIQLDPKNYRIHGAKNKEMIRKSLADCGAGRSILIDGEDVVIAGNGVYEEAQALGIPVRIIESDGSELIAIKRKDLKSDDTRRKALALADNLTNDLSIFDSAAILADFTSEELDAWEFEFDMQGIDLLDDIEKNNFTKTVKRESDVFEVTFVLPKSIQADFDAYVKANGKDTLTQILISEICQGVEAK